MVKIKKKFFFIIARYFARGILSVCLGLLNRTQADAGSVFSPTPSIVFASGEIFCLVDSKPNSVDKPK